MCKSINNLIKSSLFPSYLKSGDITPIYKKRKKDFKEIYGPGSILPVLSKLYEKRFLKQMLSFLKSLSQSHVASENVTTGNNAFCSEVEEVCRWRCSF